MSSGGPIEGKQEGESPAFRAGKGHKFPTCEPRKGHCGSVGAKGQWGSPHEIEISLLFRELGVFIMSNPGNSGFHEPASDGGRNMGFDTVTLGRTGLKVTRLGVGSFYGVEATMVEEAMERGFTYFYRGALRTPGMATGIRRMAKSRRTDMVIAMHTHARFGYGLTRLIQKGLRKLGVEYIDVLIFRT